MEKFFLSRRKLLQWSAMATVGSTLAACAPKIVEVEKVVKETVPVEVEKVVKETVVIEKVVGEPITIEFWNASWAFLVSEGMIQAYKESHPNITVNQSDIGENVFGDQKFMTAVAAGTGPSLALQNRHTFLQFAAKGVYLDVTPYFDKAGLKRDNWLPVQLEESSWKGRIYGLPIWTDTRYLFWNPQQFQEVGLDPAKPPATWTELEEFTEKLTQKNSKGEVERYGFVPYLFGNSWMWLYGFLNKAPAISDDKRTILCDDSRWLEALKWMVSFYDKYVGSFELANAFSESVAAAGLGDPFVAGKVSMVAHGDFLVGALLRSPDVKWDCAAMPIPSGGEKSTWSCGYSLAMPPSAKYPEAAWELMAWWTTTEGWLAKAAATKAEVERAWAREGIEGEAKYWPDDACYLPALEMLEEKYVSLLGPTEQKAWALAMDALQHWTHGCATEMGLAALEYWVEMDNAVRDALSHKKTPQQALADCKLKVQEATDRAWEAIERKNE